eukprot:TRINITY_DN29397_c0_g1_i1.p2 TRINITY_DN29397_c0_g1~~TRINITY_DN29397_c0_g1_i1.p2  ORF type:complete len:147 (+),score=45.43 TRINITY_DN29397_c0_g1_i1:137-577(+)
MARSRRSAPPARAPARAPPRAAAPPPAQHHSAPPPAMPQQQAPSMMGGMMGMIGQGLAFGTGSAVAHRAVDAVMGPRGGGGHEASQPQPDVAAAQQQQQQQPTDCAWQTKAFQDCVQSNTSDISKCQFYVDLLSECKKSGTTAATL